MERPRGGFSDWKIMAGNNGHFSRQGQHNNNNKNRNRNRNRRHTGGGHTGSNQSGGSGSNRVLDSNGPDVKLRGTSQTIAEKYMQLGRDAQLSGDNVMAESYYQHGEHYYRLWLANQPAGQPIQFLRRTNEDEFEDEQSEANDGEDDGQNNESPAAESTESAELPAASDDTEGAGQQADGQRNNRPRENGRERFRQRWPRRNDRQVEGQRDAASENAERPVEQAGDSEGGQGNWETPSFLTRPVPTIAAETDADAGEAAPERRPKREFRPRRIKEEVVPGDVVPPESGE